MNAPAHALIAVAALAAGRRRRYARHALLGAVLPDLPMFGFYVYQKFIGSTEQLIWSTLYFQPEWQLLFDLFNDTFSNFFAIN